MSATRILSLIGIVAVAAFVVAVLLLPSFGTTSVSKTATAAAINATSMASYAARAVSPGTKATQAVRFADFCRTQILAYDPAARQPELSACLFAGDTSIGPEDDYSGRDFTAASLTNASLIGATFVATRFTDADLSGAKLSHERLSTNFTDADFTGASLTYASLPNANLTEANFTDADLRGAHLYGRDATGEIAYWATLGGAIWHNTTCPDGADSDKAGGTCANNLIVD